MLCYDILLQQSSETCCMSRLSIHSRSHPTRSPVRQGPGSLTREYSYLTTGSSFRRRPLCLCLCLPRDPQPKTARDGVTHASASWHRQRGPRPAGVRLETAARRSALVCFPVGEQAQWKAASALCPARTGKSRTSNRPSPEHYIVVLSAATFLPRRRAELKTRQIETGGQAPPLRCIIDSQYFSFTKKEKSSSVQLPETSTESAPHVHGRRCNLNKSKKKPLQGVYNHYLNTQR